MSPISNQEITWQKHTNRTLRRWQDLRYPSISKTCQSMVDHVDLCGPKQQVTSATAPWPGISERKPRTHPAAWVAFHVDLPQNLGLAPWCSTEVHGVRVPRPWPCKNWQFSISLKFELVTNLQFTALIEGQACIAASCTKLDNPELCPQKIDKMKSGLGDERPTCWVVSALSAVSSSWSSSRIYNILRTWQL